MSVIGILSPRCCSFFRGSWLILSGRNMPSSPSAETGNRLIKARIESHSAVAREYLEVIEFFLCELILKKVEDIIRGVPKSGNDCAGSGRHVQCTNSSLVFVEARAQLELVLQIRSYCFSAPGR